MIGGLRRPLRSGTLKTLLVLLLCLFVSTNAFAQKSTAQKSGGGEDIGDIAPVTDVKEIPDKLPNADTRDSNSPGLNIVGGTEATPGEYPWQARVTPSGYTIYCGGSLIATQWVLTAAHCVYGKSASSFTITLGDHNAYSNEGTEQTRSVSQIIVHPSYNSSTSDNDVALMKLSSAVTLNSRVQTIPLVTSPADDSLVAPGVMATVTGWGATSEGGSSSSVLREVAVPIVSNTTCNSSSSYGGEITANMLCAGYASGGKDSCQGDSGGPLAVANGSSWKLAGVVSFGNGCARANYYGVYSRVSRFVSWINGYVGSTPPPPPPPSGLQNGGFESGSSPWLQSSSGGYGLIATQRPRSGSYSAWLAGYNNGSDSIGQTITVPSGAALKYYVYISTQESGSTAYDYFRVRVYSSGGSLLGTLRTYSNASTKNTWVSDSLSLSAYAGQTVRISFEGTNDSSLTTSFFVDDVSVQ